VTVTPLWTVIGSGNVNGVSLSLHTCMTSHVTRDMIITAIDAFCSSLVSLPAYSYKVCLFANNVIFIARCAYIPHSM